MEVKLLTTEDISNVLFNDNILYWKYSTGYFRSVTNKPYVSAESEYHIGIFTFKFECRLIDKNEYKDIRTIMKVIINNKNLKRTVTIDEKEFFGFYYTHEFINIAKSWIIEIQGLINALVQKGKIA